jgi:hypothetical protein
MRTRATNGPIGAQAIAGSYVVLLGMNLDEKAVDGLLGFAIERTDHTEGQRFFLDNFLLLEANDRSGGAEPDHSSLQNPFQDFVWGDYTAKPHHSYTYRVSAMYKAANGPREGDAVELMVQTEGDDLDRHTVLFNRGVAASQAYARRFGTKRPDEVPNDEAWRWLSRGLFEAMVRFIGRANGAEWGLRASVYEFQHPPVLDAFAVAARAGADVKIVYDAVNTKTGPRTMNQAAIATAGLGDHVIPRTRAKISHNKFIVLLRNGKPQAVWTGSTNFTDGGIYGHSNVGHAVNDPRVAARYLDYWGELSGDPKRSDAQTWNAAATKIPPGKPRAGSLTTVFSPRDSLEALEWYAKLMDGAKQSVFLTAAFGVSEQLRTVFERDRDYLRYLLLDNTQGGIDTIRRDQDNLISVGGEIGTGGWHQWVEEKLTNLNKHVEYIHTKYMLVDPLSDDPIVISGSANFSKASTTDNDENMLVIRGDQPVADVYLTEFMRLFTHYRLRGRAGVKPDQKAPGPGAPARSRSKLYLRDDDSWARPFYVSGSPPAKERLLFS